MLGCRDKSSGIEQRTENLRVGGSIPPLGTIILSVISKCYADFCAARDTRIFLLGVILGVGVGGLASGNCGKHSQHSISAFSPLYLICYENSRSGLS